MSRLRQRIAGHLAARGLEVDLDSFIIAQGARRVLRYAGSLHTSGDDWPFWTAEALDAAGAAVHLTGRDTMTACARGCSCSDRGYQRDVRAS